MKEIQLSQGRNCRNKGKYVALVDDEDYERLNQWKWCAHKDKTTFYADRNIYNNGKQTTIRMHWEVLNGKGIDHIDHNGLNNQKSNLRRCTQSENMMNASKRENTSSIYKGVCFFKRYNKWTAYININKKPIFLGNFYTEVEAAKAYNKKAIELFLEFANLNIIKENG